jgi:prefoldin subunit 5
MDQQAQKAFDKLNAKLDILNKEIDGMKASVDDLAEFDEKVEKVIEDKVFEIKGLAYITLIISAVLLALVIGALLRAYAG